MTLRWNGDDTISGPRSKSGNAVFRQRTGNISLDTWFVAAQCETIGLPIKRRALMRIIPDRRQIMSALLISMIINLGMILLSFSDGLPGGQVGVWISDALAAPAGVVADRVFAPKEHTVTAFIGAAAASLAFSICFYTVVALLLLKVISHRASEGARGV